LGQGKDEVGVDTKTGKVIVKINPRYFRLAEVESLLGDATKAKEKLGWFTEFSFDDLVEDMCKNGI
jgi:GDPmannose 4,6-dehydratase